MGAPDGSVALVEKIRVAIGGTDQGMFLTGDRADAPVLLFLHGGPGMPEYWLTERYPTGLERAFLVCWWDQPGAGLSRRAGRAGGGLHEDRIVADTLAVTRYLRERFDRDRIYLMAHSWGTYVGLRAVALDPGSFHAYVAVAQITHQIRSEAEAAAYLRRYYEQAGDRRTAGRIGAAPIAPGRPLPRSYERIRDRAMHRAGVGTTRDMRSVVTGLFWPSWTCDAYTLRETVDLWRGKVSSRRSDLWPRMLATDLASRIPRLEVPAYFLHGRHDRTVSYAMAKAYVDALEAPSKGFYTFEGSAHSPFLEEPARTMAVMTGDVLHGTTRLADEG